MPPLGPDDERVGPPDEVLLDLLSGEVITSVPQVGRTGERGPSRVAWPGTPIRDVPVTLLGLPSVLVGGRAGTRKEQGLGLGGPVGKPEGAKF